MFGRIFRRSASKHSEEQSNSEPALYRAAVAAANRELNDPWVCQATACYNAEERLIFLMTYECFILWIILQAARPRLQRQEVQDLSNRVREAFVAFGKHDPTVFSKILPLMCDYMPMALKPGAQTGAVYPLPTIIQTASFAGYSLPQKILDYRLGIHVLLVMKRVADSMRES